MNLYTKAYNNSFGDLENLWTSHFHKIIHFVTEIGVRREKIGTDTELNKKTEKLLKSYGFIWGAPVVNSINTSTAETD